MAPAVPLRTVAGRFYRAILADRVQDVLAPPGPESAGRYHRPGQSALYVTPEPDWAIIAVGGYMAEDRRPRLVVPLDIADTSVFDQHDPEACRALGIDREQSNANWRAALADGREPPSWRNADAARAIAADGIIDRSPGITGGWHVTLFRWNSLGGPRVVVSGPSLMIDYHDARARWASPESWTMPIWGESDADRAH